MRKPLVLVALALYFTAVGWLLGDRFGRPTAPNNRTPEPNNGTPEPNTGTPAPAVEYDVKFVRVSGLSRVLRLGEVEEEEFWDTTRMLSRVQFAGKTYWVVLSYSGKGTPYCTVGVYAPTEGGEHYLCMEAESCGAGNIKPELDEGTGMLVLREHAASRLEGQVILSCNLRSVGNHHSVSDK
jgi:hypothetical protein